MVSFKELCGLTPAANMKQCILTVSTWLMNSERSLRVTVDLSETYPTMEAQGPVPELLRKVLNAYDMVNELQTHTSPYITQHSVIAEVVHIPARSPPVLPNCTEQNKEGCRVAPSLNAALPLTRATQLKGFHKAFKHG